MFILKSILLALSIGFNLLILSSIFSYNIAAIDKNTYINCGGIPEEFIISECIKEHSVGWPVSYFWFNQGFNLIDNSGLLIPNCSESDSINKPSCQLNIGGIILSFAFWVGISATAIYLYLAYRQSSQTAS